MSDETSEARTRRRRAGRVLTLLLWYGLPGVAAAAVAAYIVGAVVWHANPPVVPVEGVSMRPTLEAGDLVFLEGANPKRLRKGDIVAVRVPASARAKYGLPGELVHRIVRIERTRSGLEFVTKGDANATNDVFMTPASNVVGREAGVIPGLGYPFLFFRSRQGEIFAGAVVVVGILYFLLGVFEERRAFSEGTAVAFETILTETDKLKEALAAREAGARGPPTGAGPALTPSGSPVRAPEGDNLIEEVREGNERSQETSEVLRQLVGAIGEYGTHLKSHTEVMVNLAATTRELQQATSEMREAVTGGTPDEAGLTEKPVTEPEPTTIPSAIAPAAIVVPDPTPLRRSLRGYSREGVEALLATMRMRIELAEQRLVQLERQNVQLATERDMLRAEAVRYERLEQSLAETLALAQKTAAEIERRAEEEAERVVGPARGSAADLVRRATVDHERLLEEAQRIRTLLEQAASSPPVAPAPPERPPTAPATGDERPEDKGEGVYLPE